jgi:hypothetical protein
LNILKALQFKTGDLDSLYDTLPYSSSPYVSLKDLKVLFTRLETQAIEVRPNPSCIASVN